MGSRIASLSYQLFITDCSKAVLSLWFFLLIVISVSLSNVFLLIIIQVDYIFS